MDLVQPGNSARNHSKIWRAAQLGGRPLRGVGLLRASIRLFAAQRFEEDIAELDRRPLALKGDEAAGDRRFCGHILQKPVDEKGYLVPFAHGLESIPLS